MRGNCWAGWGIFGQTSEDGRLSFILKQPCLSLTNSVLRLGRFSPDWGS